MANNVPAKKQLFAVRSREKRPRRNADAREMLEQLVSPLWRFQNMPVEIKVMIYSEALRKPGLHYLRAVKVDGGLDLDEPWTLRLATMSGDRSAFRVWNQLVAGVDDVHMRTAYNLSMQEPFRLGNSRVVKLDLENDLVCFEFARGSTSDWNGTVFFEKVGDQGRERYGRWTDIRRVLAPFRKVALRWQDNWPVNSDLVAGANSAFSCFCELCTAEHEGHCLCSDDVAQFLDLFPSIEEFYLLIAPRHNDRKKLATEYNRHCSLQPSYKTRSLARFYDAKNCFWEWDHERAKVRGDLRIPGPSSTVKHLISLMDNPVSLLRLIESDFKATAISPSLEEFKLPSKHRSRVIFRAIVESAEPEPLIGTITGNPVDAENERAAATTSETKNGPRTRAQFKLATSPFEEATAGPSTHATRTTPKSKTKVGARAEATGGAPTQS